MGTGKQLGTLGQRDAGWLSALGLARSSVAG